MAVRMGTWDHVYQVLKAISLFVPSLGCKFRLVTIYRLPSNNELLHGMTAIRVIEMPIEKI
jgi:hypothetical protein